MGVIAELLQVVTSRIKQKDRFPGESVISNAKGMGGATHDAELYALPGVTVVPPENSRLIFIPVGGTRKAGVCIAGHNYQITIEASQGETVIHSTSADGKTLQATVKLDAQGNINLNGDDKRLVTYSELSTALSGFVTALNAEFATKQDTPGTPGSLSLDISAAETQTVRTGG